MKLIALTQGKFAQVDDDDYELIINHGSWCAHKEKITWYATGRQKAKMHRLILGISDPNIKIDHIDKNGLNNQRSNLRLCNTMQNCRNRTIVGVSKYMGVHKSDLRYTKKNGTKVVYHGWKSEIRINGVKTHIGRFKTEEDAARAYDEMAKKYHEGFGVLNFK